jgi:hypothetical protein
MSIVGAIDSNGNAWPLGSISGRFDLPEGTKLLIDDGDTDVRKILLDMVPGEDGESLEVYANSAADVVRKLSEMGERIEELEGQLAKLQKGLK